MLDNTFERNSALQPISRDHGVLLVLVQRLRKAAQGTKQDRILLAGEIRNKFAGLVDSYLSDETDSLALLEFSQLVWGEIVSDHASIVREVNKLGGLSDDDLTPDRFLALAELIENHVRWDERTVLPYLQREVAESDWAKLVAKTAQVERNHSRPIKKLHHSISLDKKAGLAQTCTCADSVDEA